MSCYEIWLADIRWVVKTANNKFAHLTDVSLDNWRMNVTSFFITSSGNTVKRWKSAKECAANTVVDVAVRGTYNNQKTRFQGIHFAHRANTALGTKMAT